MASSYESLHLKFGITEFKASQKETIDNLLQGKYVYLSVKTGAGKNLTYQAFQPFWGDRNHKDCSVLVVSQLILIMKCCLLFPPLDNSEILVFM